MPVSDDGKAIVAAILAASRISQGGTERGASTPKAYVDEFLRMLHQVRHPDADLKDYSVPDPI